jgi:hypothetical protein
MRQTPNSHNALLNNAQRRRGIKQTSFKPCKKKGRKEREPTRVSRGFSQSIIYIHTPALRALSAE